MVYSHHRVSETQPCVLTYCFVCEKGYLEYVWKNLFLLQVLTEFCEDTWLFTTFIYINHIELIYPNNLLCVLSLKNEIKNRDRWRLRNADCKANRKCFGAGQQGFFKIKQKDEWMMRSSEPSISISAVSSEVCRKSIAHLLFSLDVPRSVSHKYK